MPPRRRLRRGAWEGSRQAKAGAAACLAVVVLALTAPGPALAYRCEDAPAVSTSGLVVEDCRPPQEERAERPPRKRGSMSGLTVFVLAVAAALLIPIGARGIPTSIDPYSSPDP